MSALTRGPLPAHVYWRRRIVVLGTAFLLVFGFARLLGAASDASSGEPQAAQVAAGQTSSAPASVTASTAVTPEATQPGRHASSTPLAEPEGPCSDEDVTVTPDVKDAVAGRDVTVELELTSTDAEACTWQVSRNTVTLKITSGKDDIWSSRECPRAIPERDVVVRRDKPAEVAVTWNGKRSDEECSRLTQWALPGYYHVVAAALAGEPDDEQFQLKTPTAPVITRSPSPHQEPKQDRPSGRPVTSPSGSVD